MNSKQRKTLEAVFTTPTPESIRWTDIESLLEALGADIRGGGGSMVRVTLNGVVAVFHPAAPESHRLQKPGRLRANLSETGGSETMMEYKGYIGKVEYDDDDGLFHGMVGNINDVVTFFGSTVDELRHAFKEAVETYLAYCAETGKTPERPYSGRFNVRLDPSLHREVAEVAKAKGESINTFVAESLQRAIQTY